MLRKIATIAVLLPCIALARAPKGKPVEPEKEEQAKLEAIKGQVQGVIAWSSSRDGNHDIFLMDADGTNVRKLTKSKKTDWYSRISPDGQKVIFTRSKLDWTNEMAANFPERWDTWIINIDGTDEKKLIDNSTWATWNAAGDKIIYARGVDVFTVNADGTGEEKLIDGEKELMGGIAQSPHLSDDGKFCVLTLRGKQRETGILNMETRKWSKSVGGGGCQINFFPNSHKVFWIHPTGKGGTQVFHTDLKADGSHAELKGGDQIDGKSAVLIDLPFRRSHEYFPEVSPDGKWLVWAATARGHDHDIADYEIFIWKIGDKPENATQLTFHSGNDRWPHIWMPAN